MRCFFCLEEKDPTEEHVFPEAIGGTLITDRVCKPCNDFLGARVDHLLTEHLAVLVKRADLGMTKRSGKPVDPLGLMSKTGTLADDPSKRVQLRVDPSTGKVVPRLIYHSHATTHDDGREEVHLFADESEPERLTTALQRERKRRNLPPLSEEELKTFHEGVRTQTIDGPCVIYKFQVDVQDFKRAICKICYELACIWLGDTYLNDPVAAQLRNFILNGEGTEIRGDVFLNGKHDALRFWEREPSAHIAYCMNVGDNAAIAVRIFDAISGLIHVTSNAAQYPALLDGRFVLNDPATGALRESTLPEELLRLWRRFREAGQAQA